MSPAARRPLLANLVLRGFWAVVVLVLVKYLPMLHFISTSSASQTLVNAHLAFNLSLLFLALPFTARLERLFVQLLPDIAEVQLSHEIEHRSILDDSMLDTPALALASLRREVLRMVQLCEVMLSPVMEVYRSGDKEHARALIAQDQHLNDALDGIRKYVADLATVSMTKVDKELSYDLVEYAIAIETVGDRTWLNAWCLGHCKN